MPQDSKQTINNTLTINNNYTNTVTSSTKSAGLLLFSIAVLYATLTAPEETIHPIVKIGVFFVGMCLFLNSIDNPYKNYHNNMTHSHVLKPTDGESNYSWIPRVPSLVRGFFEKSSDSNTSSNFSAQTPTPVLRITN